MSYINYQPCPYRHKYELINWAMNRFPTDKDDKKIPRSHWKNMKIKQLKAIFFNCNNRKQL